MSKRTQKTKSLSFLLEFLFVLFFFAISALVCIQIYAKSLHLDEQANAKKLALEYVQEVIESKQVPMQSNLYLNKEGKTVEKKDAYYVVRVKVNNDEYPHYTLEVVYQEEVLITLPYYQSEVMTNE